MTLEMVESTLNINCDMIMTTALAAVLLLIGFWIKKKVPFLTKYCIPAPVIGGFLFMFISFAGHQTGAFSFDFIHLPPSTLFRCGRVMVRLSTV